MNSGEELFFQGVQAALPLVLFIVVKIAHKHWMSTKEPADA